MDNKQIRELKEIPCPDCQKQDEFVKDCKKHVRVHKTLISGIAFIPYSVAENLVNSLCEQYEAETRRADEAEKENEKLTESKSFFKKVVIERMKTNRQQAERIAYLEAYLGQSKP